MKAYRVLSFAAGSGKLAYVFLVGGKLMDWLNSSRASLSPEAAQRFAERCIDECKPDVVVIEDTTKARHKGERAKAIIAAIAAVAEDQQILCAAVQRPRHFSNKYIEAAALAERFPEFQPLVPKPRQLWDGEPREVAYFEALALALEVIDREDAAPSHDIH